MIAWFNCITWWIEYSLPRVLIVFYILHFHTTLCVLVKAFSMFFFVMHILSGVISFTFLSIKLNIYKGCK